MTRLEGGEGWRLPRVENWKSETKTKMCHLCDSSRVLNITRLCTLILMNTQTLRKVNVDPTKLSLE